MRLAWASRYPRDVVRAMLLIRANTLAKGYSGIRPRVVEALLALLNADILPVVPSQGSLGASGDLAPLAHVSLVLLGMGEALAPVRFELDQTQPAAQPPQPEMRYERVSGMEALRRVGLEPLELEAKEGLALTNGTALVTALAALAVHDAEKLCHAADIVAALSMEALAAVPTALDPRIHTVRPHPRQIDAAAYLRRMLEGSEMLYPAGIVERQQLPPGLPLKVQDAYSLRCAPQVHGAVRDAAAYGRWAVEIELNSATDNPLILPEEQSGQEGSYTALSGGNFHAEPLALAMDFLKLGLTELGNISERRLARLIDPACNGGILPAFLIAHGGLNSGFMLVQYTAAALASENKVLVHPASADSIPTSANQEDHVSMGATAGRQAHTILDHVRGIVACEAFAAAQGIDLRRRGAGQDCKLGRGTAVAYEIIRSHVPFIEHDEVMEHGIQAIKRLIASEELVNAVEAATGKQ
ncbi:MAG: histidine ammonia-lyase [Herpetosiphonaceae bacterium]|nr:MAG: histidine ammonia-lyase [Herpetosiphonaceae bacterium]